MVADMKVDMLADMMVDMVADITFDTFVLLWSTWSAWLARNISVLPSALAPLGKDTGHCIVCPAVFHCGFPIIVIIISISLRSSSIRGEKLHFLVSSVMFLESPQWMPLHREIFFALLHCLI